MSYVKRKSQYKKYGRRAPSANTLSIRASEKKTYGLEITSGGVGNATTMYTLNQVAASGIPGGRIGGQIKMLGLYVNLLFHPSATDENNVCRVLLGISKGGILINDDGPQDFYEPPACDKYHILFDYTFCGALNNASAGVLPSFKSWYFNMKARKAQYSGTAGNTLSNGQICLWLVSDSGAVPNPTIAGYSRLVFCE